MSETDKLNYQAGAAIANGDYEKAIQLILDGSGDLQLVALLALAREVRDLTAIYRSPEK